MSCNSDLADFAVRLRRFICASANVPENGYEHRQGGNGKTIPDQPAFDQLALDLFGLQFTHNTPYRRFCETRRVRPQTLTHWTEIPAIPAAAFKELDLSCLPAEERNAVFLSSGTSGQTPSRHFHNPQSLAVYEASAFPWFTTHLLPSGDQPGGLTDAPWQLAILTPPPSSAPNSSLVHMFDTIRRAFGFSETAFLASLAETGWSLDLEAVRKILEESSTTKQPLTILGTAFSFVHLLDHLADRNLHFRLPPGSRVLETGGYKDRSRSLPKQALHALITQRLDIPPTHIVCEYGMSELSSQAYDTAAGPLRSTLDAPRLFRFPPWARVQIISPETGVTVGDGETGLIRVLDLANVYSVAALQTEDLGIRQGDGFKLIGRATLAEPRGCSLMAT